MDKNFISFVRKGKKPSDLPQVMPLVTALVLDDSILHNFTIVTIAIT